MITIKIVGRNHIFSPLCVIEAVHNKRNCVIYNSWVYKILSGIINNYAYSGRLLK